MKPSESVEEMDIHSIRHGKVESSLYFIFSSQKLLISQVFAPSFRRLAKERIEEEYHIP